MATATLTINQGKRVTLSSTASKLREVVIPVGTMGIWVSSDYKFYFDFAGTVDEGDETVASQFMYQPGTYFIPVWTLGGRLQEALRSTLTIYIIGAGTSQNIYMFPVSAR